MNKYDINEVAPYRYIAQAQGSYVHNVTYGYGMTKDKAKRMAKRAAMRGERFSESFTPVRIIITTNDIAGFAMLQAAIWE